MAAATPLIVGENSQTALVEFAKQCYGMLEQQWNLRNQFRSIDLAYQRELDYTTEHANAQLSNRSGDPTKFQNVVVPVVMPQVEAAVTYQASVFLTGNPIFGWTAPPGQEDAALQFQAITEENQIRGGWTQQFMMFFKDIFKYNLGFLETTFGRKVSVAIESDIDFTARGQGKPKEVIWQGNVIERWDPYNTFWDTRYQPSSVYKDGEFIGRTQLMSRTHLKKFIAELPDKMVSNIRAAFESGITSPNFEGGINSFHVPEINRNALLQTNLAVPGTTNWGAWAGLLTRPANEIQYKDLYEVTTLYARIIPQDFLIKVPSANTVQIWKFILVNNEVLIYAERQTNAHNLLPVVIGQPYEDGLGYQTKSLAENSRPFQEVGSALVNSAMAARRRAISDRGIYNPLLISAAHINNDSPTAKIPMRPAGYNKNPAEAYYAIPYRDDQSGTAFQELSQILGLADTLNGSNRAKQGQFTKGNRTVREFDSVMANANGRDQAVAIVLEAQVMTPIKEIMKINTLQFQQGVTIYSQTQERAVKIDPVQLRKAAVTYRISDGLVPSDKLINGDDFAMALQTVGSSPQINSQYNMAPMFSYLMKTRNVDLRPFEKSAAQIAYEQAIGAWQEAVTQIAKTSGKDGQQPTFPPQPKPQDYGYDPNAQRQQTANPASAPSNGNSGVASGSVSTGLPNQGAQ